MFAAMFHQKNSRTIVSTPCRQRAAFRLTQRFDDSLPLFWLVCALPKCSDDATQLLRYQGAGGSGATPVTRLFAERPAVKL